MNNTTTRRLARYFALPIVTAGIVGGAPSAWPVPPTRPPST
jgi:hypothetical protein